MTPFRRTLVVLFSVLALLAPAAVANAAAAKPEVLAAWTQPTASSTAAWNAARRARGPGGSDGVDRAPADCTARPGRPLGFDFTLSCWHHDFGYRNYKDIGQFSANKARLDNTFYADLKRKCAEYSSLVRPACNSLAWTYYQAVAIFGSVSAVKQSDIDRARRLMP